MQASPFEIEHLGAISFGANERYEMAALGIDAADRLRDAKGPAWTLRADGGRIVGCFGVNIIGGDGVVWVLLSDDARTQPFALHRTARRCMAEVEQNPDIVRLHGIVIEGDDAARRWIERFGFEEKGILVMGGIKYTRFMKWRQAH